MPKWRYTLANTNPIFFYSSAGDDCDHYGMVGVINVSENSTGPPRQSTIYSLITLSAHQGNQTILEMQYDMALDSPGVVQPSAAFSAARTAISETASAPSSSPTTSSQPAAQATVVVLSPSLSQGSTAGIIIGCIVAVALIGAGFYWCGRRHSSGGGSKHSSTWPTVTAGGTMPRPPRPYPPMSTDFTPHGGGGWIQIPAPGAGAGLSMPTPFVAGDTIYLPVKRGADVPPLSLPPPPSTTALVRGGTGRDAALVGGQGQPWSGGFGLGGGGGLTMGSNNTTAANVFRPSKGGKQQYQQQQQQQQQRPQQKQRGRDLPPMPGSTVTAAMPPVSATLFPTRNGAAASANTNGRPWQQYLRTSSRPCELSG